jgi:hypothetical protein
MAATKNTETKLVVDVEGRPDVEEAILDQIAAKVNEAEAKASPKKPAAKKAEPKPEAPSVDLAKLLFEGLAAEGVKAKKVSPPTSSHYFKIEVDGKLVAFVNLRKGGALRVEPKLVGGRAPKGFEAQEKVRQGLGFVATISTEKEIGNAVAAVKLAAEKAAEPKA